MGYRLKSPIRLSALASALGLPISEKDIEIRSVAPFSEQEADSLSFIAKGASYALGHPGAVFVPKGAKASQVVSGAVPLPVDRARFEFVRALGWLEANIGFAARSVETRIHPSVLLGRNVEIGEGVEIGENTVIGHNVVIDRGVRIGRNCIIKSNSVIGENGFGFERDETGFPLRFPHLGSVVLEDDVEIGALNTVCRGTLNDTIIRRGTKTDDHVHVGHNCIIGPQNLITACTETGAGIRTGKNVWIGPNSSIIEKVTIGDSAFIGIGTLVLRDVAPNTTVVGVPARVLPPKDQRSS